MYFLVFNKDTTALYQHSDTWWKIATFSIYFLEFRYKLIQYVKKFIFCFFSTSTFFLLGGVLINEVSLAL